MRGFFAPRRPCFGAACADALRARPSGRRRAIPGAGLFRAARFQAAPTQRRFLSEARQKPRLRTSRRACRASEEE
jgi:hypothetical protein